MQCFLCSILFSIMMLQNSMTVQEPHTAKSFLSFTFAIRTSMERLQKHVEMVQNNAKTIRIEKNKVCSMPSNRTVLSQGDKSHLFAW